MTRIPAYASLMRMGNVDYVAEDFTEAAARAYRSIKLHGRTVETIAAARAAVGPDIAVMLDRNCTWSPDQAVDMARRLKEPNLFWLEEPVSPHDDFNGLAQVRRDAAIPVAAGEKLGTFNDFRRMVEAVAVDFIQPDVTKMGGITEMWKAVAFVAERDVRLEPHSPLHGHGHGLIATQHLIATMKTDAMCEFYFCDLGASPMGDAIQAVDGMMQVPDDPGLSVEVDEQVIACYRTG